MDMGERYTYDGTKSASPPLMKREQLSGEGDCCDVVSVITCNVMLYMFSVI
jgi:hypothetical protein